MRTTRWLVHATAVLHGDLTAGTLSAVESSLQAGGFHVFHGIDLRRDRARHRLAFATITGGASEHHALYTTLLDVRIAVTGAGAKLEGIEDDAIQRLAP